MKRSYLTDECVVRTYTHLDAKMSEIQTEIRQLLQILTTPIKITKNERFILLNLPTHLIKTYFALQSFGKITADECSKRTNKARAIESNYLNQLVRMGFCLKSRSGRKVVFSCNIDEKENVRGNTKNDR